jgi:DNA topoisomerase VI subunit B
LVVVCCLERASPVVLTINKGGPVLKKLPNKCKWRGTELSLTIEGAWVGYRAFILRYLRQIAVITPYAQFVFKYNALEDRNSISMLFKRRTDVVPAPPAQACTLL